MNAEEPGALVSISRHGPIGVLRLHRPRARNAVNRRMLEDLHRAIAKADAGPRAIVLTGGPEIFCAGADIREYSGATQEQLAEYTQEAGRFCTRLRQLPVPVIAAVEGYALGGGFELVLSCDLVVAAANATFALPELKLGLIPGWGGTQRLTELVGRLRSTQMIMTGRGLPAAEARDLGVVNYVCEPGTALDRACALATTLSTGPAGALAAAKSAIAAANPDADPQGFELERAELIRIFATADSREGIRAFMERRDAVFARTSPAGQGPS